MSSLLEEKESTIGHLQDRISTLEQRLQETNLSGDDKVKALEAEVHRIYTVLMKG